MKRPRITPERRTFERETLRKIAGAGATPGHLERCRWLLVQGRKRSTDDMEALLNKTSQEKAGIEYTLRSLRGDAPWFIILNRRPMPDASYHG